MVGSQVLSLSGKDTITIDYGGESRVLNDFADGNVATLTFPNRKLDPKVGKNGNAMYNYNQTGNIVEFELRVIAGSSDDKFLNTINKTFDNDPASFKTFSATFAKRVGDGAGKVTIATYSMSGGCINQGIDSGENAEGDTEYNVAVYKITFTNSVRNLG